MEQTLREIVAKIAEITADFDAAANLHDDLDVDSVRAMEVVFEIERRFNIVVPEGRFGDVRTFNDLLKLGCSITS